MTTGRINQVTIVLPVQSEDRVGYDISKLTINEHSFLFSRECDIAVAHCLGAGRCPVFSFPR